MQSCYVRRFSSLYDQCRHSIILYIQSLSEHVIDIVYEKAIITEAIKPLTQACIRKDTEHNLTPALCRATCERLCPSLFLHGPLS